MKLKVVAISAVAATALALVATTARAQQRGRRTARAHEHRPGRRHRTPAPGRWSTCARAGTPPTTGPSSTSSAARPATGWSTARWSAAAPARRSRWPARPTWSSSSPRRTRTTSTPAATYPISTVLNPGSADAAADQVRRGLRGLRQRRPRAGRPGGVPGVPAAQPGPGGRRRGAPADAAVRDRHRVGRATPRPTRASPGSAAGRTRAMTGWSSTSTPRRCRTPSSAYRLDTSTIVVGFSGQNVPAVIGGPANVHFGLPQLRSLSWTNYGNGTASAFVTTASRHGFRVMVPGQPDPPGGGRRLLRPRPDLGRALAYSGPDRRTAPAGGGLGVASMSPVGAGIPVTGSMWKTTTVSERSLATYRYGSTSIRSRGHDPPAGTSPTRAGRGPPMAITLTVLGPRLAT